MKKIIAVTLTIIITISMFSTITYAQTSQQPQIVETKYETDDIVIADIIVTESPYNADNTGVNDCTSIIQKAIDDCAENGGGTVFLPVGKYRLTGNIKIKQFVTLMGDWQDPDIGNEYGTIIIADINSEDIMSPGLITVGSSAGAVGLTIWYPSQTIENVKPYPFTFYITGNEDYMLQTIKNCTMLNSYRGIGASSECENGIYQCHEMLTIENVKGTCLYQGLNAYNSADVDTFKTLYLLNKYWAEAGEDFNAPKLDELNAYTRTYGIGMVLGDLEWPMFTDIKISDFNYGINIRKGPRYAFGGTFWDLSITNCNYGFYADKSSVAISGKNWGISIYNGVIEGSVKAICDKDRDRLGLTNVKVKGKISGINIRRNTTSVGVAELDYKATHKKPVSNLFVAELDKTGKTDISLSLQNVLNEAGVNGGIVYIPAGLYRIEHPVTVPSNVELRGASSVANRCQRENSSGTLILSFYGYSEDSNPLITLGENSGISGIRIDYPLNNPIDESGYYTKTSPVIYSNSNGVYVVNSSITLASRGVLFENSNDVFIKKLVGCCLENMINLNSCQKATIEGCLQNGTCIARNGYSNFDIPELKNRLQEENLFKCLFDPITRKNTNYIVVSDSDEVTIFNSFIYGGKSFFTGKDSNTTIINVGSDGTSKDGFIFNMDGGNTTILNSMRFNQNSKYANRLYSYTKNSTVKIFSSQAMGISFHDHVIIKNVKDVQFTVCDFFNYILQPFYCLFRKISLLINK